MLNRTIFIVLIFIGVSACAGIKEYKVNFGIVKEKNKQKEWITLRSFQQDNTKKYLCVDPITLNTYILKADDGKYSQMQWKTIESKFANTPYIKAIANASKHASDMQDAGITHAIPRERGISLTIDLCPSHKPLDRIIFTEIVNEFNKVEKPAPIALSVSGIWMKDHASDLEWLKKLIDENKIRVDWINHTYSHKYSKELPLNKNFILEKGTDLSYEVFQNEIVMIENGLTPSVMFRFPGLVSDKSIFEAIVNFGLIPIGSDAWLAKNQKAIDGSIVLIHGNGNEPIGVDDFIKLIQSESNNIKDKNWLLYDLRDSVK